MGLQESEERYLEKMSCNTRLVTMQRKVIVGACGDVPIWDERDAWDDHLAGGHAEYRSWCELCVTEVSCRDVQQ